MSDPVKNVEDVEDVLSSIRRLVSETSSEARAEPEKAEDPAPASEKPANDALILTSALRINEPAAAAPAKAPTDLDSLRKSVAGAFDEPEKDADTAEAQQDQNLHLGAFVEEDSAEPETSNIAAWPVNPPEDYYEDEVEVVQDAAVEWASDDADTADLSEGEPENFVFEADTADHVEDDVADGQAEDVQAAEHAEVVEEPWIDVANYEEIQDLSPDESSEDDAEEKTSFNDAQLEEADDASAEDHHDADHHYADHGDDHAGEAQSEDDDQGEDELGEDDAPAMATFMRSGGEDTSSAGHADHSDDDDDDDATMFGSDDDAAPVDLGDLEEAVIDEDMLRDLVAEIVRQELTGAMGERITRNVRKLVRREIHRALAAREFD